MYWLNVDWIIIIVTSIGHFEGDWVGIVSKCTMGLFRWRHPFCVYYNKSVCPGNRAKPLFQSDALGAKHDFLFYVQVKLISPRKFLHLDSLWKWEFLELGKGLFVPQTKVQKCSFNTTLTQPLYILHEFIHAILKIQHWILTSRLNISAYNVCLLTVKANQWSNWQRKLSSS